MNRIAWHIPLAVILSISAHFCLISLLGGGNAGPDPVDPLNPPGTLQAAPGKPRIARDKEMETYPIFQDNSEPGEESFESPSLVREPNGDNDPETHEPLAKPRPLIRIEADENYRVPIN